jgi:DNA-binding LacI/PurR family transcriptional regulator
MAGKKAGVSGTDTKLRPRLADVAEQAGVSPATASCVLTGSARVRPETRREVEEAIARLGYVRNRAPRSSAPRRTGSIGFVVCEDNSRVLTEPFSPLMLRGISRELSARGIQLALLMAHSSLDYQIASRYLRSGHVDGAVLVGMHGKRPLDLHSLGMPVVLAGRPFSSDDDLSYVDADNVGGARMAVQYMSPGVDRLRGYRMTMAEAGLSDSGLIVFGDFGRVSAEHAANRRNRLVHCCDDSQRAAVIAE